MAKYKVRVSSVTEFWCETDDADDIYDLARDIALNTDKFSDNVEVQVLIEG